jgi:hypothetical protein
MTNNLGRLGGGIMYAATMTVVNLPLNVFDGGKKKTLIFVFIFD